MCATSAASSPDFIQPVGVDVLVIKKSPPQGVRNDCVLVAKTSPISACSFGARLISPQRWIKREELE
jgi:hypothetical protein